MKNKKGELTSKQLITIIILIISFTIIVAFFVMLGLKLIISDESCRNSVMLRGTFSNILLVGRDLISLKCKTEDICFNMGGECSVETERTIKVKDREELIKKMGDLLVDCWWMMGEGKVDYGSKGDCAICYRLYFDEEVNNQIGGTIEGIEFYDYMNKNKISDNGQSYLSYLYGNEDIRMDSVNTKSKDTYAVVTSIPQKEGLISRLTSYFEKGKQIPPVFIKFNTEELKTLGCTNYLTEV